MLQLFKPELRMIIKSGFIYLPLLLDPDIAKEARDHSYPELKKLSPATLNLIIAREGRQFIRSVHIQSLLDNFERIDDGYYHQLKRVLWKSRNLPQIEAISHKGKLQNIILKIMPYFIRQRKGLSRRNLNDEEILDLISSKVNIPQSAMAKANKILDPESLLKRLDFLNKTARTIPPLQDGLITGEALRDWFSSALEAQIMNREKARLEQELKEREGLSESKRNHIAALLYIAEQGTFEMDGFGFSRIGSKDDYLIYMHTGEFILKDYYGQSYLFPDCRVAVSTAGPLRPIVIERYKHPFLLDHAPRQEICLRDYEWPDKFSAENVIRLLEDGINALVFGYDARRRNGYHTLDPTLYYVKTIEFAEYRI